VDANLTAPTVAPRNGMCFTCRQGCSKPRYVK